MPKPPDGPPADWAGFHAPRYTQIPDELFDVWLPHLSEAELKVLLYIMRHTFGWKKDSDAISLRQMAEGVVRRDGTRLDSGAGVAMRSIHRALPELERKGLIIADRQHNEQGDPATTVYSIRMAGGQGQFDPAPRLSDPTPTDNLAQGVGSNLPPQETTVQETAYKNGSAPPLPPAALTALYDTAPDLAAINWQRAAVLCAERGADRFVQDLHTAAASVARKARGDKAGAYWAAVEGQG